MRAFQRRRERDLAAGATDPNPTGGFIPGSAQAGSIVPPAVSGKC